MIKIENFLWCLGTDSHHECWKHSRVCSRCNRKFKCEGIEKYERNLKVELAKLDYSKMWPVYQPVFNELFEQE